MASAAIGAGWAAAPGYCRAVAAAVVWLRVWAERATASGQGNGLVAVVGAVAVDVRAVVLAPGASPASDGRSSLGFGLDPMPFG
jgi:hydroxymethylglutaryl-CoA reductase